MSEPRAVGVARAHVRAWSNHDFDGARRLLAEEVRVTVTSTNPALPTTDLAGVDRYMAGLVAYAEPIPPGSTQVLAAVGDDRNALLMISLSMAGGPFGDSTAAPCARLYLVDDDGKIKAEQVIFYLENR